MSDERTKSDDQARLDRLFEYTKFHIGIYIAAAGAMITIAGSEHLQDFFDGLCMPFLWAAIAAMVLGGHGRRPHRQLMRKCQDL